MSDDLKLKKKHEAAKARVARWEAWALALRDGRDAEVYLDEQESLFREMVSRYPAFCHIPVIQRPRQLQAHSGAKAIPNRRNTIIDFAAATYLAQGPDPEFSFKTIPESDRICGEEGQEGVG